MMSFSCKRSKLLLRNNKAFSLVELSIVLVILGLLTGGILAGQALIRAAELRSVTTEYKNYQTAVRAFQYKYFAIPGDMANATAFWGAFSTGTCTSGTGSGTETCDGNGDGQIDLAAGGGQFGETYGFWQHLANAGLIEGSYTGKTGPTTSGNSVTGENTPASRLSSAGWDVRFRDATGTTELYAIDYGNYFSFGADNGTSTHTATVMTPEEAWSVDTKVDDGLPAYGKVVARYWNNACSAANNGSHANNNFDASYRLSSSNISCALMFKKVF